MKKALKTYINKLFTYLPVAVFVYSVLVIINISQTVIDLKSEFGIEAIDEFISLYVFYYIRTIILAFLLPLFEFVFSSQKISYRMAIMLHCLLVTTTVAALIYVPGIPILSLILSIGTCIIIYVIISVIIFIREKQFINDANKIFMESNQ